MTAQQKTTLCCGLFSGVSAAFAVKLFKSWINEKDINSVAVSLRKVGMDNRLMVNGWDINWDCWEKNLGFGFSFLLVTVPYRCLQVLRLLFVYKFTLNISAPQELFPANKRSCEHFSKYFTDAGLKELSDFARNQQSIGARKELQKELQEQMFRGDPQKEVRLLKGSKFTTSCSLGSLSEATTALLQTIWL